MEGHWCERVRAWTHRLFVCQCALREDETMSFRELGGACLGVLLAAATPIPAARRVTHSVVSFQVLSLSDIVMARGEEWPRRSRASPKIQHLAVSTQQLPSR